MTEAVDVALAELFDELDWAITEAETFSDAIGVIVAPWRRLLDGDGAISDRYGVRSLPTMVLIDKRGIVRWIHVGHLPETGELRDLLHRLAAE